MQQKKKKKILQGLVRDRLHLVTLHQTYANEENWNEYSNTVSEYLPLLVRTWYLKKERENALKQLRKHQIETSKQALDLLKDCLDTLAIKYPPCNALDDEEDEKKTEETSSVISYFFGDNRPTSFDAVVVSELIALNCCKLPTIYVKDSSVINNQKYQKLFQYAERVFLHCCSSMNKKLKKDKFNHIMHAGQQTRKLPSFPFSQGSKSFTGFSKLFGADKYGSGKLSDDSQTSLLFLLGSVTAVAIYWKCFQPLSNSGSKSSSK
ncbi:hypothetical protein RFI_27368 [Reticulomyxa filosa]|uniref:Uncharacterized protein n=1 Tax=Reticulomyxa filosa TaxID=46433 RepID=X6M960_RETFI|nr:hypothetical protein RFI_27368 [Reticulomyxa filosa]|eukprot:ETO10012.1 hypothetical protein RFI_27368 [Reticulomyxa filosa]